MLVSFDSIVLSEDKVTEIVSVVDSSGNKFYEVPFLKTRYTCLKMKKTLI